MRKPALWIGLAWLGLCGAGFSVLWRHQNEPGLEAAAPERWPKDSLLALDDRRLTLVLFMHPQCPCTRAAVRELERVLCHFEQNYRVHVVAHAPEGVTDDWVESDVWHLAHALPGAECLRDDGGVEVRRFGVETSGQVLVYRPDGRLAFSGGLTSVRGHEGRSAGIVALETLARRDAEFVSALPVFGCSMFESIEEEQ